jgi:two-component sensor histidine kinase
MALIHEKLYQSNDLARIDFSEYTRNLTNYLAHSFENYSSKIKLYTNVDKILLGVDSAVPCGLIINELVSNSLKYAFPDNRDGKISIDFRKNGESEFILTIDDNGIGFPGEVDFQNMNSFGLQLVNTLTKQLGGMIELDTNCGTKFTIAFPTPKIKEEKQEICQK